MSARRIAGGLSWPECPRRHDGALWFTDMYTGTLRRIDDSGDVRIVVDTAARAARVEVPVVLGGFGWLPDGRLLVVSMYERPLLVSDESTEDATAPIR